MKLLHIGIAMIVIGAILYSYAQGFFTLPIGLSTTAKEAVNMVSNIFGVMFLGGGAGVIAMTRRVA